MGQEEEKEKRKAIFSSYQVNSKLLELALPDALVMHCLPAYRGWEISADVLDGRQSVVVDQAENRLHAQKALMAMLM
jgi:ornithine carbamoyltransferase